jgi:methionine-rich copper-binding protein CopC
MRKIFAAALSVSLLCSATPMAEAHSTLISSLPKNGAVLKALPREVTLRFNEELLVIAGKQPNTLRIASPTGESIAAGLVKVDGNSVSISVTSEKAKKIAGRYKVSYRVASADGHVISGQYYFTIR